MSAVAAMREACRILGNDFNHDDTTIALLQACADVAKLIAADLELDAAYAEFPAPGTAMRAEIEAAATRVAVAKSSRADALDRIGGAA